MTVKLQALFDAANARTNSIAGSEVSFVSSARLPKADEPALEKQEWIRVEGVACSFIDMVNSSKIDHTNHPKTSCRIYESFVGNLVSIWRAFGVGYFDLKGDGGFALFDGKHAIIRAFLATETFRSWVSSYLSDKVRKMSRAEHGELEVASRSALNLGAVDVKRIGYRGSQNQNLIWLNSTINQASKLLSLADRAASEVVASEAAYKQLSKCDEIKWSCGCKGGTPGSRTLLWTFREHPSLEPVGLRGAYHLTSFWCRVHGSPFMDRIVQSHHIHVGPV